MGSRPGEGGGGAARAGRFLAARARGSAGDLHGRPLPSELTVTFLDLVRPAVVLGSTQSLEEVDVDAATAAGIDVVRRRSGGGAVFVRSEDLVWADVFVPAGDRLWDADVGRAFHWLGDVWAAVVGDGAVVHTGALVSSAWSAKVCFAGLGPGEVTVGGRKVVGLAQRRTRAGALFQCACLLTWDPATLVSLLRLGPGAAADLAGLAGGLGRTAASVEAALVEALTDGGVR
jgi:lipoate---protein ligase